MRRSKNYSLVAVITLCILLTLCVIPAMAAEGEENKEISYATSYDTNVTVSTDNYVTVLPEVDTDKNEDTDVASNEIIIKSDDMTIDDADHLREHRIPIYCEGKASSFTIEFEMPYFVEVSGIEISDNLKKPENAVSDYSIDRNYIYVAYSSPTDFEDEVLFYVTFYLSEGTLKDSGRIYDYDMQFVNSSAEEVWGYCDFGRITVDADIDVLMGDANQDNEVNLEDVMFILRYKVHGDEISEYGFYAADIDGNGRVDMVDCQYIQNYLVGAIDSLENINGSTEEDKEQEDNVTDATCDHLPTYEYSRTDATCNKEGYIIYRCSCGENEITRTFAPTGKHAYVDGKCLDCGAVEGESDEGGSDAPSTDSGKTDAEDTTPDDEVTETKTQKYTYKDETSYFVLYDDGTVEGTVREYTADGVVTETAIDGKWAIDDSNTITVYYGEYKVAFVILAETGEFVRQ
ncbi:MAG: dockerin type I repeat-containing protein [Clostridia bacterium]|nr:dockerin type I repeat-containing protein [Clostridia bacterium]